jgi:F-type H+-transporting ATPase subunit b
MRLVDQKTLPAMMVAGVLTICFFAFATTVQGAAAGHADSATLLKDFLYRVFNFAVTFGILAYFIARPIRKSLAARREGIAKTLQEAEAAKLDAEARYVEYENKLTRASAEIDEIYAAIRREGEVEREKIIANAREMALKIVEEAEKTAANEVARARADLRQEASVLAINIAEGLLRQKITEEDQSRLVNEYTQKMGELH